MTDFAHWARWLAEAEASPADVQLWDGLEGFIATLRDIAARKAEEADALRRRRRTLDQLRLIGSAHGDQLLYLGLSAVDLVNVPVLAKNAAWDELDARAGRILAALKEIMTLRQRSCRTFAEEEERTAAIRQLRQSLERDYAALPIESTELAASELSFVPPTSRQGAPPSPVEPAASDAIVAVEGEVGGEAAGEASGTASAEPACEPSGSQPSQEFAVSVPDEPAHELPDRASRSELTASDPVELPEPALEPALTTVGTLESGYELPTQGPAAAPVSEVLDPEQTHVRDVPVISAAASPSGSPVDSAAAALDDSLATLPELPSEPDPEPERSRAIVQGGGNGLRVLDDDELRETLTGLVQACAPAEALVRLLVDQQRRWLRRRQLLRAHVAARYLADHHPDAEPAPVQAWLCWLVVLLFDPGAQRIDFRAQEFAASLYSFCSMPQPIALQRFLVCWFCAALIGPYADRARQLAVHLRPSLWDADWAHHEFFYFCRLHLIEPVRLGKLLRFPSKDTTEGLRERMAEHAKRADKIVSLSNNYRNALVKRFWPSLVGPGGPVQRLLDGVRHATVPDPLPGVDEIAGSHPDWSRIEAHYRRNMESRLGTFLDELRGALVLQRQLQQQTGADQQHAVLSAAEVERALEHTPALQAQLDTDGCPSLGGFELLVERLHKIREVYV